MCNRHFLIGVRVRTKSRGPNPSASTKDTPQTRRRLLHPYTYRAIGGCGIVYTVCVTVPDPRIQATKDTPRNASKSSRAERLHLGGENVAALGHFCDH